SDPLTDLIALLDDLDVQSLARQSDQLEGVGQFVQVDDLHALQLSNLVQVEVVGHDAGAKGFGQHDQALVNLVRVAQLTEIGLVHLQFHFGIGLHPLEDIQAAPAAIALNLVGTVRDALQFLKDKTGHDHLGVDDPRIAYIGNPAVNNYTRIQNQGP